MLSFVGQEQCRLVAGQLVVLVEAAAIGHWCGITIGVVFIFLWLMYRTYFLCMTQLQCRYKTQLVGGSYWQIMLCLMPSEAGFVACA